MPSPDSEPLGLGEPELGDPDMDGVFEGFPDPLGEGEPDWGEGDPDCGDGEPDCGEGDPDCGDGDPDCGGGLPEPPVGVGGV